MYRIELLRKEPLDNEISLDEFYYGFFKHYCNNSDKSNNRYADAFYEAFSNYSPCISEGELIVGKYGRNLGESEKEEWINTYKPMAEEIARNAGYGQDSHMSIDYDLILKCGIKGIISKIDTYISTCEEDKKPFYTTCRKCLEAVIVLSESYAREALRLADECKDADRSAELKKIASVCKKVPANPAGSFYEAVQSVHFVTFCISHDPIRFCPQQFQLGHPDRYLISYYLEDIKKGEITKEYAQLLLDCLGIQINNRVPRGLSSGYMVGGRDENNNIIDNELTQMCMQVIDDIRLVYPSVGLCYTNGMKDDSLDTACEILSHGRSHPAVFNDDVITKGLISYGVPAVEAHNYIHSTCVEITPGGSSNVWVASPYTNMPQILLDVLCREYDSFEDVISEIFNKLDAGIKYNFECHDDLRKYRSSHSVMPLLSCFVNDCLKRGLDIENGGARYNWIMPSFVGVANLVDSLYVVKNLIFDKKRFTVKELKEILDADFNGYEALRMEILNNMPKYGNDIDEIDSYFGIIIEHIISECEKYHSIHSNSNLIPSVFCWEMHERFGRETGATSDGRKAGFPLGDGSGPCQGREINGPTASVLSSTKWDHHRLIGGVAVNMKFSKGALGAQSVNAMKALVKTYMLRGGFEIQINVTDNKILESALQNPDEYRDLVVRIGGYSDYFVKLTPQMQQEVMLRIEHRI